MCPSYLASPDRRLATDGRLREAAASERAPARRGEAPSATREPHTALGTQHAHGTRKMGHGTARESEALSATGAPRKIEIFTRIFTRKTALR